MLLRVSSISGKSFTKHKQSLEIENLQNEIYNNKAFPQFQCTCTMFVPSTANRAKIFRSCVGKVSVCKRKERNRNKWERIIQPSNEAA